MSVKSFLQNNSSNILTGFGVVGVIGTAVLTAYATPKAMRLLHNAECEKGEPLTKFEKVRMATPAYIPAAVTGIATISCVIGANVLNRRQQASLMSAYALLDRSYRGYRSKVKELYGEDADNQILEEVAKERFDEESFDTLIEEEVPLFFDERTGQFFNSTVLKAVLDDGLECYIISS